VGFTLSGYFEIPLILLALTAITATWMIPDLWYFRHAPKLILQDRTTLPAQLMIYVFGVLFSHALLSLAVFYTAGQIALNHASNGVAGIAPRNVLWYGLALSALWLVWRSGRIRALRQIELLFAEVRRREKMVKLALYFAADRRLLELVGNSDRPN
jgi:hypothetical protein